MGLIPLASPLQLYATHVSPGEGTGELPMSLDAAQAFKQELRAGTVAQSCSSSSWKAEAGGLGPD